MDKEFQDTLNEADSGDMYSMFAVGEYYRLGYHTEKNPEKAYEYHHKAAALGHPTAIVATALDLINGSGVAKNEQKGYMYLKTVSDIFDDNPDEVFFGDIAKASYLVGLGYMYGKLGIFSKDKNALPYLERAAKLGHAQSQVLVGSLYYTGKGIKHDLDKCIFWTACAYLHGKNSPKESDKARETLNFFLEHGIPGGKDYIDGIVADIKKNYKKYIVNPEENI